MNINNFMPILLKAILAFITMNMFINFFLFSTRRLRIYKILSIYWLILLNVYVTQSLLQTGILAMIMANSVNIVSYTFLAMIGFEAIGRRFPIKEYILYFLPFYPITFILNYFGFGFSQVALPLAIAMATPLLHAFWNINIIGHGVTGPLQKFLGSIYLLQAIHCISFAFFNMEPAFEFLGWPATYVLYHLVTILLPAMTLEETRLSEDKRLQTLVNERTQELNKTSKENGNLLKVILHDLSSPLMTMRFYLHYLKVDKENEDYLERTKKSHSAMEKILLEIKCIYSKNNRTNLNLQPVALEECFNDVYLIFTPNLEKKNISLTFNNLLSSNTRVMADQTTLTHSVLSNLVSNGLKFSYPHSQIQVTAKELLDFVILEVKDQGPGMSEEVICNILQDKDLNSSEGTLGEMGAGFGLSIVKSFVNSYGGKIEFHSQSKTSHPLEHGTSIRITLNKAST